MKNPKTIAIVVGTLVLIGVGFFFFRGPKPIIEIKAEHPFLPNSPFPIANTYTSAVLAIVVILVLAYYGARKASLIPHPLQNFVEAVLEAGYNICVATAGEKNGRRFFPVFMTIFVFIWVRWTLPRFRYDQLMSLGWKTMLPMALAYIVIVAAAVLALDYFRVPRGIFSGLAMLAVNIVLVIITFFILDRGRIISPAYGRATPQQVARLRAVTAARSHLSPQSGD